MAWTRILTYDDIPEICERIKARVADKAWRCDYCGSHNWATRLKCENCAGPMPDPTRATPFCGYFAGEPIADRVPTSGSGLDSSLAWWVYGTQ